MLVSNSSIFRMQQNYVMLFHNRTRFLYMLYLILFVLISMRTYGTRRRNAVVCFVFHFRFTTILEMLSMSYPLWTEF